jgi:hypothetical protein
VGTGDPEKKDGAAMPAAPSIKCVRSAQLFTNRSFSRTVRPSWTRFTR